MKQLKPQLLLSLKSYSKAAFVKDVVAGIIVAIIALPLSIALALASGVGPEQGIYTAIIAGFIISALGGSKVQIAGPTAAFASIVAGIVAENGMSGLATATIMAGIMLVIMGVLQLGSLIKYIPYTITTGFTAGIAVTIIIGQLKDFFGLTFVNKPIETVDKVKEVVACFGSVNYMAVVIGLIALAILIIWPYFSKKIPSSLVAVIVTSLVVKTANVQVNTIGDLYTISSALPKLTMPSFQLETMIRVAPDSFTIAILAAIESLLSAVVADEMIGSRHNSNMELVAQGVGNAASALFGGIPATGAIARTAANIKNGATSPVAGMVHAVVLLLTLVLLMPYAALIPMPCIAAILFMVAYNMSGWRNCKAIIEKSPISDTIVMVLTFALTVLFDLVVAIAIGMIIAVLLFMKRMTDEAEISEWEYVEDGADPDGKLRPVPSHVMVYEITGPMFFAVADKIPHISSKETHKVMILRMRAVPALDITALNSLERLRRECQRNDIQMILSHVNEQPMAVMKKSGFYNEENARFFAANIDEALELASQIHGIEAS
ncbi:MAG: SulP family inorganic anion transporter [Eubacteriales bacterium]|nr:SulP family inorganic anion transporter [Eubacteriales bacterium]